MNRKKKDKNGQLPSLTFVVEAIRDSQNIIRAVDFKTSIILVILALPLTKLDRIYSILIALFQRCLENQVHLVLLKILVILFAVSWLVSFYVSLQGLIAMGDPRAHLTVPKGVTGVFYSGDLNKVSVVKMLFNINAGTTKASVTSRIKRYPKSIEQISKELIYEHMKITFIRDVKMSRHRMGFYTGIAWVLSGGGLWLGYLEMIN